MFNKRMIDQKEIFPINRNIFKSDMNYKYKDNLNKNYLIIEDNDPRSTRGTPRVWSHDMMTITAPKENKGNKGNKTFHNKKSKYDKIREVRAGIILAKEEPLRQIENGTFLVKSQTGHGHYLVEWKDNNWTCNCQDYVKNNRPCKHVIARDLYFNGYVTIEDQIPEIEKASYSQDWSNYNQAQTNEIELFDHFLHQLVSTIPEPEQHMGRPQIKLRDQLFCCVMKVYSQLSLRNAQCLYTQALERQQIASDPYYNVVSATLVKKEITPLLIDLVHLSAMSLASVETNFAIDSSGFRCSTFSDYCRVKHGTNRRHNWLKVHIATGTQSNIVGDVIITDEYAADSPQFKKLMKNISKIFEINEIYADPAYSGVKNLQIVDKFGGTAYIPFKKNATGKTGGALWKKAFHYFQLHRDEFDKHYHQRSNAEATFAAIKKKFGETIKSRNRVAQENEMLCKIIAYNITVLIHAMYELGINPEFIHPSQGCRQPNKSF